MPRSTSLHLCLLALVLCAAPAFAAGRSAPASPAAPRNLLLNPGFEKTSPERDWQPANWDTSDSGLETVFFGRDTFFVHSGRYAISVANTSTLFPMGHNWSQTLLVTPAMWGKTAVFRIWTRSNGLDGRAYLLAQAYRDTISRMAVIWGIERELARRRMGINEIDDPLIDLSWQRTTFTDANTEWVQREARVRLVPGTNVLFVRCGLVGLGQVLFDDASLTLEPATATKPYALHQNLFRDPSFEEGGTAWDFAIPPFEGAHLDVDTTVAHTGRASVRLSNFFDGLVQARMGVAQPFDGRPLRGMRVQLTAWLKGDSVLTSSYLKIYSHGLKTHVQQSPGYDRLDGQWDWKPLKIEYDVPDDAELVWVWCVTNAPAKGTVWYDDLDFEVEGPAPKPVKKAGSH